MIQPVHAVMLGIIEGLTEFLPVSSTGHLILAARMLGLGGEAVKTFEVVIQAGALIAVLGLYRARVVSMARALCAQDARGKTLLCNLGISFLPAALVGTLLHRTIKALLFSTWPVVAALTVGGLFMISLDRWLQGQGPPRARTIESLTLLEALLIGMAQCVSLWPGTSRAMVTISAGLLLGLPAPVAAEYSFLLALPTLGAATLFDVVTKGRILVHGVSPLSIAYGLLTAAVVALLAIRGFLQYLTRRGLAPFGWYRLSLAALIWALIPRS